MRWLTAVLIFFLATPRRSIPLAALLLALGAPGSASAILVFDPDPLRQTSEQEYDNPIGISDQFAGVGLFESYGPYTEQRSTIDQTGIDYYGRVQNGGSLDIDASSYLTAVFTPDRHYNVTVLFDFVAPAYPGRGRGWVELREVATGFLLFDLPVGTQGAGVREVDVLSGVAYQLSINQAEPLADYSTWNVNVIFTPEPSSALLIGIGIAGLALRKEKS